MTKPTLIEIRDMRCNFNFFDVECLIYNSKILRYKTNKHCAVVGVSFKNIFCYLYRSYFGIYFKISDLF